MPGESITPARDQDPNLPAQKDSGLEEKNDTIPDAAEEIQEGNYGSRSYGHPGTDEADEDIAAE